MCMRPVFAFLVLSISATNAAESTYTRLDDGACRSIEASAASGDREEQALEKLCFGLMGLPVHVHKAGDRVDVDFAAPNGAWESFDAPAKLNDVLEWRIENEATRATILRWFVEVPRDGGRSRAEQPPSPNGRKPGEAGDTSSATAEPAAKAEAQILVVSKVGTEEAPGCVVGYVDALANDDANVLARSIADDIVPGFRCGEDDPEYVGKTGEHAPEPVITRATIPDPHAFLPVMIEPDVPPSEPGD